GHFARDHFSHFGEVERMIADELLEGGAVDELGDDVAVSRFRPRVVVDFQDVFVPELGDCVRLALEATARFRQRGEVGMEDLNRYLAVERGVEPAIDLGHSTLANLLKELVPLWQGCHAHPPARPQATSLLSSTRKPSNSSWD